MKRFWIRRALRFLAFALLAGVLLGFTIMTLWNALLPAILGVSAITFWQALGLLLLSRILFGGPRGGGFGGGGWRGGPGRSQWKEKMTERWQRMTPEQRQRLKQQWRDTCGNGGRGRRRTQPEPPDSGETSEPGSTTI